MGHADLVLDVGFRIPFKIFQYREEYGDGFFSPRDDFVNQDFGERTPMAVQERENLLDLHGASKATISNEVFESWSLAVVWFHWPWLVGIVRRSGQLGGG